jgi:hypothetical protein
MLNINKIHVLRFRIFFILPILFFSTAHAAETYRPLSQEDIRSVEASSFLNVGNPTAWRPENLVDKRPECPWVPDRNKPFNGEWIRVNFKKRFVISKIGIVIGHAASALNFRNDGRPKKVTLVFSNGFAKDIDLDDTMEMQYFTLDNIKSKYIKLILQEKYEGLTLSDVCVGELEITVKENKK